MNPTVKILDRIKKLLAMSHGKGGSANEVAVAAAEAARLMQLHKLTEADLPSDDTEGPDMVDLPAGADFLDSWRFVLITSVARSFMCEAVGLRSAGRRKVRVVGRREDVEVSLEVYRHLAEEIERLTASYEGEAHDQDENFVDLWDDVFGTGMSSMDRARFNIQHRGFGGGGSFYRQPVSISPERREAYRDGLVVGVSTKLKEQKVTFEASGEKAMVVARKSKEEVRSYITTKFADPRKVEKEVPIASSMDEIDFARGFQRGQEVAVNQPPGKAPKEEEGPPPVTVEESSPTSEPEKPAEPPAAPPAPSGDEKP